MKIDYVLKIMTLLFAKLERTRSTRGGQYVVNMKRPICSCFPKSAQKRLFLKFFFQKFACIAKNVVEIRSVECYGSARKINLPT